MVVDRVAGAPLSWGGCGGSGGGGQLSPPRGVAGMGGGGLEATEFGPDGFLPEAPRDKAELLRSYQLDAVGGFVPVVLHVRSHDVMATIDPVLAAFSAAGAGVLVLSADSGRTGYDERVVLDDA